MAAVAFDVRFRKVVIKKRVVLEASRAELFGIEVECPFQNLKGLLLIQNPSGKKVADLQNEIVRLLQNGRLGLFQTFSQNQHGISGGEALRAQFEKTLGGMLEKPEERGLQALGGFGPLVEHDVIHGKREQRASLRFEVGDAIPDGGIDNRIRIELVWDGLVVALEQVLVQAAIFIEQFEGRLQALGETIDRRLVQALVVDAANFENDPDFSGLGQEDFGSDEPVEIHLFRERAGFLVVLENSLEFKHLFPCEPQSGRTSSGHTRCEAWPRSARSAESGDRFVWPSGPRSRAARTS